MTWQVAAGVIGLLLVAGFAAWYKLKDTSSDAVLAKNAADQAGAAQVLAEKQLQAKNESDRKALNEQVTRILSIQDKDAKQRAALELLARVRGIH